MAVGLLSTRSRETTLADQLVFEALLVFFESLLAVFVGHVVDDAVQVDLFLRPVAVVLSAELLDLVFVDAHDELGLRRAFGVLFDDDAVAVSDLFEHLLAVESAEVVVGALYLFVGVAQVFEEVRRRSRVEEAVGLEHLQDHVLQLGLCGRDVVLLVSGTRPGP